MDNEGLDRLRAHNVGMSYAEFIMRRSELRAQANALRSNAIFGQEVIALHGVRFGRNDRARYRMMG
jgi:hypothetical protein